ncbi:hypothetical protein [Enterobacter cancerogenus]
MYLVKSCKQKDNILERRTIRIGSLEEYRNTEEAQIADDGEGSILLTFDLKNIHMPFELLKILQMYNDGESTYNIISSRHNGMSAFYSECAFLEEFKAQTSLIKHNRFAFCISKLLNPNLAKGIFPDYDDYWHLRYEKIQTFAKLLGMEINNEIKRRLDEGEKVFTSNINSDELSIAWHVEEIDYTERHTIVDNRYFYCNYDKLINALANSHLIKPKDFSHENEVRFVYDAYYKGTLLKPLINSLIVDANSILPLILK